MSHGDRPAGGARHRRGAVGIGHRLARQLGCGTALVLAITGCALAGPSAPAPTPRQRWYLAYDGDPRFDYAVIDYQTILSGGPHASECPAGQLFSGVVLLALQSHSGRWFAEWMPNAGRQGVATADDWVSYLHELTSAGGALRRIDSAAASLRLRTPVDISVMIPATASAEGGGPAGLKPTIATELVQLRERLRDAGLTHVRLRAAYWLEESVPPARRATVREVSSEARAAGLEFLWIPYFAAEGVAEWRSLGFDAAWLQPNFFFRPELPPSRLDSAAVRASSLGMGLELEFDHRLIDHPAFAERLAPYLATVRSRATEPLAVYDGAGTLFRLLEDDAPLSKELSRELIALLCDVTVSKFGGAAP
jgi:hypothetical protein